jgi:hypothetical protein
MRRLEPSIPLTPALSRQAGEEDFTALTDVDATPLHEEGEGTGGRARGKRNGFAKVYETGSGR